MMVVLNGKRTVVSTLAGGVNGTQGVYVDASGTNAGFSLPYGVAVDASGNVFVADRNNQRIRKVTAGDGMLREGCSHALSCLYSCIPCVVWLACLHLCCFALALAIVCLCA